MSAFNSATDSYFQYAPDAMYWPTATSTSGNTSWAAPSTRGLSNSFLPAPQGLPIGAMAHPNYAYPYSQQRALWSTALPSSLPLPQAGPQNDAYAYSQFGNGGHTVFSPSTTGFVHGYTGPNTWSSALNDRLYAGSNPNPSYSTHVVQQDFSDTSTTSASPFTYADGSSGLSPALSSSSTRSSTRSSDVRPIRLPILHPSLSGKAPSPPPSPPPAKRTRKQHSDRSKPSSQSMPKKYEHSAERDRKGQWKYQCHLCWRLLSTPGSLERHLLTFFHGGPGFPCERCEKRFSREDSAIRHEESEHHYVRKAKRGKYAKK